MLTTLTRYLLKEQLIPLSICFLGLSLILITGRLLQLTRYLFVSSVNLWDFAELMGFAMPKLIIYAFPMATLIGILLALLRLNSDSELIALRAAGIGFAQLFPAIFLVASLATLLSFCNSIYLLPQANTSFQNKLKSIGRISIPAILTEGTFIDLIPNLVFFFDSVKTTELTVKGILVQDQRQPDIRIVIIAESAQIAYQKDFSHIIFKIRNGIITRIPDNLKEAQAITFKTYELSLALDEIFGSLSTGSKGRKEMNLTELYRASYGDQKKADPRFALEFHNRLALPMSCLFLGLAGAPLGALFRQRSRLTGITLGILIFLAYYLGLSAGRGLGENRLVSPLTAMWTPNLCTAFLAAYLWIKINREAPFGPVILWTRILRRFPRIRDFFFRRTTRTR
ncbi:MAG: YjgP/YjgQ family permease [Deltaproteobacteria bacterium]|jgi:lipopolysaccharide export system permease protein|nr:YjgP/YjgQ family permease [Deltaproteobacteria bacterium]